MKWIKKTINYYKEYHKQIDEIENIALDNKIYLKDGKYNISINKKIILFKQGDKQAKDFIYKNTSHLARGYKKITPMHKIKILIKKVLVNRKIVIKNNSNNPDFNGTCLMITRKKELKIFDFKNKIVMHKLIDKITFNKIKECYELFSKYFNLLIKNYDCNNQIFYEDFLDFTPNLLLKEKDKELMLSDLFMDYYRYLSNHSKYVYNTMKVSDLLDEFKNEVDCRDLEKEVVQIIQAEGIEEDFPIIDSHGGLQLYNILYSDKKYFLIDLETYSKQYFFFDLMTLVFFETAHGDYTYIYKYFLGEFDCWMARFFEVFDVKFEKRKKLFYLTLFIIQRILQRKAQAPNEYNSIYLKKILGQVIEIQRISIKNSSDA